MMSLVVGGSFSRDIALFERLIERLAALEDNMAAMASDLPAAVSANLASYDIITVG